MQSFEEWFKGKEMSNVSFVNLTPHPLTIIEENGMSILPVDGPAPRLAVDREQLGRVGPFSCVRSTMGEPTGLPEQQDNVVIIVSALVAEHHSLRSRTDLTYPGEPVRDNDGRIVGCRGLCAGPGLAQLLRDRNEFL